MLPAVNTALEVLKGFEGHEIEYCGVGKAGRAKLAEILKAKKAEAGAETSSHHGDKGGDAASIAEKGKDVATNNGYWDDYCLAQFLRGVCLRYVAYPVRILTTSLRFGFDTEYYYPGFLCYSDRGKSTS